MEKINLKTSSKGLLDTVKANNDEVLSDTDLSYGMTSAEFTENLNSSLDAWAGETTTHISAKSTPESIAYLFNQAVDGGLVLKLTIDSITGTESADLSSTATVLLKQGETAITDTEGVYSLTRGLVYNLTITNTGYDDYTESITAITDINLDIVMTETSEESE